MSNPEQDPVLPTVSEQISYTRVLATSNPPNPSVPPRASESSQILTPTPTRPFSSFVNVLSISSPKLARFEPDNTSSTSEESDPEPSPSSISTASMGNGVQAVTQAQLQQLVDALRTHRINTITELRRVEKIFAPLNNAMLNAQMTAAWAYYVNSNQLLNELRGLSRNYPFSSELLDEAKYLVVGDANSVRYQNYCRLVLGKIRDDNLIRRHARRVAMQPAMWGNRQPSSANVEQLANACITEWSNAVALMLRHWS